MTNGRKINAVTFMDVVVFRFSLRSPISSGPKNGEHSRGQVVQLLGALTESKNAVTIPYDAGADVIGIVSWLWKNSENEKLCSLMENNACMSVACRIHTWLHPTDPSI